MGIWLNYKNVVKRNCTNSQDTQQDLMYWRNNLFASTLIFLLPLCFIALLPSLYWIYKTHLLSVAVVDLLAVAVVIFIALVPGIKIITRKIIFMVNLYVFSFAILYFVGPSGSSLVYLLACTVFSTLIFPTVYGYWPAWGNCIICFLFGACIYFNFLPVSQQHKIELGEWIAVSMNLIFLSFLNVTLIPRLFKGLQSTINKQIQLQNELIQEKQALGDALKKLSQKNGELEQFSYIASHDLQEPLRMISGFLTQLKNKYDNKLDEKALQYIRFAVDGSQRMHRIIKDLLEYSRASKIDKEVELVDLNTLFVDVKGVFTKSIEECKAVITTDQLPVINTHRTLMEQVFQNLLGNGLKYCRTDEIPRIHVSAKDINTHWEFTFKDNGIGIEKEYFEKIFIIFQRLHHKNEYSGTGIGLAITKKIVEYLGGKIWVESDPDKGSIFYFTVLKKNNNTF